MSMRAWCISNSTLHLETRPMPELGPSDVLVQVAAIGVNRADLLQTRGLYPAPQGTVQDIPGLEYSGTIVAVGAKTLHRKVGDKIMGLIPGGAYAEYLVTHEEEALTIPAGLSMAEAATIPEAYLTAYRAIYLQAGLTHGQWCLIRPATSSVGLAAVQLCQVFGNPTIGSSRNKMRLDTAQALGLQHLVTEDDSLSQQLLALTDGQGVSVIFDMVGPDWSSLLPGLRREGHLVVIGILGGNSTTINLMPFLQNRQHISALTMRSQPLAERLRMANFFNERLLTYFEADKLHPLPLQEFTFSETPLAHQHMQDNDFSGKRVITLS